MLSGPRQQQDSGQAGEGRPDPGHTQGDPEASAVSDEVPRWAVAKGQRAGPRVLRCQRLLTAGGTRVKMGGHPGHPAPLSVPSSPHLALLLGVLGVWGSWRSVSACPQGSRHLETELVLLAMKLIGGRDLRADVRERKGRRGAGEGGGGRGRLGWARSLELSALLIIPRPYTSSSLFGGRASESRKNSGC